MVLYSPDWTNIGFTFILLTVNLFRHPTLIEHGLYTLKLTVFRHRIKNVNDDFNNHWSVPCETSMNLAKRLRNYDV